jgi:coproporphyrinogen III oxidase-like Fe-S oxidoreductase
MFARISRFFMQRSFQKTRYRFGVLPRRLFQPPFGVYVHVPFCYSKCTFCPFYKEILSEEGKRAYLDCIVREIDEARLGGNDGWIYFGGGTPNTLSTSELASIVDAVTRQISPTSMGIELLPARLTCDYLDDLKRIGFTKVSFGVESFAQKVIGTTGRCAGAIGTLAKLVAHALGLGLWVNVDMMAGLPNQNAAIFMEDVRTLLSIRPSQITLYPFLVIRGLETSSRTPSRIFFEWIERAAAVIMDSGYQRKGVWTFTAGGDLYDSSRDELVEDFAGFGPAAASTCGPWKIVNPELAPYVRGIREGRPRAFVAPKNPAADEWRTFARMLYDLRVDGAEALPVPMRLLVNVLGRMGYIRRGRWTRKGTLFAHEITKAVVESLPFPLQNPACVENFGEYEMFRQ